MEVETITEPAFGTLLRACRLRWHWWDKRKCFVRATPLKDRTVIEVARTFAALSEKPPGKLHAIIKDESVLDLCEPLRVKFTRAYHSWEVGDDGKVIE